MTGDKLYLTHIIECIERIEKYTGNDPKLFLNDRMRQDAVLRNLHTLAETSTRVSPEIVRHFSKVPWKEMRAFRHVVVHDYLGLDLNKIWNIIQEDLPPVKAAAQEALSLFP